MRIVQEMTPEDLSHIEIDLVPFKEEEDNDLSPNAIKMLIELLKKTLMI